MTDKTDIAALKRPVRDRYDWSNAVWRDCDQCGKQHTGTVTAEDDSQICAHCADQLYWSAWQVLAERALDQLEVVSKSEWKLAGELTELQMNYNALQQKYEAERQRCAEITEQYVDRTTALSFATQRAEAAEKERDDLKSAHGNMVTRCALLRQRTDLPVDRVPAYNALVKAQEEIAAMKAQMVNPVVLPAGYSTRNGHPFHEGERNVMIPNKHGDWLSRFDVEHAIHFAGFTVKGER